MIRKTNRSDDDFRDEIEAHIQLEADQLMADGMAPDEALAAARRAFGNVTRAEERYYESSRRMWLDHLLRDTKYALRQLRRSPVSTATIIASLALGVGLTTAIFSLADQTLVRDLPVAEPAELVQLKWDGYFVAAGMGNVGFGDLIPMPLYLQLRDDKADNDVFSDLFARFASEVHLRSQGPSRPAQAELVTGGYFSTLGVPPAAGRLISDSDDSPGAHPVVVLSHEYWQLQLGGGADVLGSQVRVNDQPMTVIGIAPQGFYGTNWASAADLWIPMSLKEQVTPGWNGLEARRERFSQVFGRLAPDIDRQQAAAQLQGWFKSYQRADTESEDWPVVTESQLQAHLTSNLDLQSGARGQSHLQSRVRQPIFILLAATLSILLLACLNVANLSLARALAGQRATALRSALGASRWRIVAEQLVESALLAILGCLFGVLLAPAVSRAVLSFLASQGGGSLGIEPALDVRLLLVALAAAVITTLISGAAPAFYAASVRPVNALKQQATAVAGGLGVRKALVVGQFVLALILLIGAGLFANTLGTLKAQGPGFSTTNLLMFRVEPASDGYESAANRPLLHRLLQTLDAMPEVERAGVASFAMLSGGGWNNPITIEAGERIVTDRSIPMNAVSPDFFATLGTPIVRGRGFNERDRNEEPGSDLRSVVVNETFVERYLSETDPIGARLGIGDRPNTEATIEIVGVVQSFRDFQLRETEPQVFFSLWQRRAGAGTFYVRTRTASETAQRSIQAAIQQAEPALTVLSMRTLDDQLDRMLGSERMLATLAAAFAVLATLLAMIGLYGVLSFSAERRTKEIGIRLALGAQRWEAGGLIVREALTMATIGLIIALPGAWAFGQLIESQLFGVRPMDLATLAGAAALLTVTCLLASWLPARRVGAMDPLKSLRSE